MTFAVPLLAALWLGSPASAPAASYHPVGIHSAAAAADAPAKRIPKEDKRFGRVASLIAGGKPAEAIEVLDSIIADQEKAHPGETRQVYCARSPAELLLYTGMGAKAGRDTVVLGPDWSMAIFLKGFALIDLGRRDEAKPLFDRAVAMSPMNAQFLGELAEWHKNRREWAEAYKLFERARLASEFSPEDTKSHDLRRGMRGMGFVLIEQGRLDEAEALFRKCLELEPNDAGAKTELRYIEEQRAKAAPRSA
jgi:tetratricopeptide (TPR) repeat protein